MNRFRDAWRAEWTKLRTVPATWWLAIVTVASGIGLSAGMCGVIRDGGPDPVRLALSGVQLSQAIIAIWAIRAVTGEFRSGMMRTTLTAIPLRCKVIAAKTAVIAAFTLPVSTVTVGGALLVGRLLLRDHFGAPIRAAAGSIVCLGLISVLATGISFAVRGTATATGIVLGLLYGFPLAVQLIDNHSWQRLLQDIGPTTTGIAVLAGWAAAAILLGEISLETLDT